MKPDEEKVLADALRLPTTARATIAGHLLKSLDDEEDPAEVEAAWAKEIDRRKSELSSGAVKALTKEEAYRLIASDDPTDDSR